MAEAEEAAESALRLIEEDYRRTIEAGRQTESHQEEDLGSRAACANGYHSIKGDEGEDEDEDEDDGDVRPGHEGYQALGALNAEASEEDEDEDENENEGQASDRAGEQKSSSSGATSSESEEQPQRARMSEEDKECIRNAMSNIDMPVPAWAKDIDNAIIMQQVNRLLAANNLGHRTPQ